MKQFQSFSHIGIRGLAALTIVVGHYFTDFAPKLEKNYPSPVYIDYMSAVTIFFLLSGTALVQGYHKKDLKNSATRAMFWMKRFARIYPMYLFALLISIPSLVVYSPGTVDTALTVIFSLLMIQSLTLIGNQWFVNFKNSDKNFFL